MGVITKNDWLEPRFSVIHVPNSPKLVQVNGMKLWRNENNGYMLRRQINPLGKIIAFGPDQKDPNHSKISGYHLVRVLWDEEEIGRLIQIEHLMLLHTVPIEEGLLHWSEEVRGYYQKRAKREIARS